MQQKHKTQIPLNPLNFSPIGIDCRNGKKNLERQYTMSSSIKVMAIPFMKTRGNQTILRIQRLQKDEININISIKEKSKQKDPKREF